MTCRFEDNISEYFDSIPINECINLHRIRGKKCTEYYDYAGASSLIASVPGDYNDIQNYTNNDVHGWIMNDAPEYIKQFYQTRPSYNDVFDKLFNLIDDCDNLPVLFGQMSIYGISNLINLTIQPNIKNYETNKFYCVSLSEPSLSLIIKNNYSEEDNLMKFKKFIIALKLNPDVVLLETMLSFDIYDIEHKGNPRKICNEVLWNDFLDNSEIKSFWEDYFTFLGFYPKIINIENPKSLNFIEKIIMSYDISVIKDYLKWNVIQDLGFYTDLDKHLARFNPFKQIGMKWITLTYDIYKSEINNWQIQKTNPQYIERAKLIVEQLKITLKEYYSSNEIDSDVKLRFIQKLEKIQIIVELHHQNVKI
jgi:hypothetical protein